MLSLLLPLSLVLLLAPIIYFNSANNNSNIAGFASQSNVVGKSDVDVDEQQQSTPLRSEYWEMNDNEEEDDEKDDDHVTNTGVVNFDVDIGEHNQIEERIFVIDTVTAEIPSTESKIQISTTVPSTVYLPSFTENDDDNRSNDLRWFPILHHHYEAPDLASKDRSNNENDIEIISTPQSEIFLENRMAIPMEVVVVATTATPINPTPTYSSKQKNLAKPDVDSNNVNVEVDINLDVIVDFDSDSSNQSQEIPILETELTFVPLLSSSSNPVLPTQTPAWLEYQLVNTVATGENQNLKYAYVDTETTTTLKPTSTSTPTSTPTTATPTTEHLLDQLVDQIQSIAQVFFHLPSQIFEKLLDRFQKKLTTAKDNQTTTTTEQTTEPTTTTTTTLESKTTLDFFEFLKTLSGSKLDDEDDDDDDDEDENSELPYNMFIDEVLDNLHEQEEIEDDQFVSDLGRPIEVDTTGIPVRFIGDPLNKSTFLGTVSRSIFTFNSKNFSANDSQQLRDLLGNRTIDEVQTRFVLLNGIKYRHMTPWSRSNECRCRISNTNADDNSFTGEDRVQVECEKKLVLVLAAGFDHSTDKAPYQRLSDALIKFTDPSDQVGTVVLVDWQFDMITSKYHSTFENLQLIGRLVTYFVERLRQSCAIRPKMVHLIGHGLGGQIAGFSGKYSQRAYNWTFGRITGLDVSGLLFENTGPDMHLARGDADFVDAIHANIGDMHNSKQSGFIKPYADLDFYPNRGGGQPHCPHFLAECNYYASVNYFAYSIMGSKLCEFEAYPCRDYLSGDPRNRHNIDSVMGYYSNQDHSGENEARGVRCLRTSVRFPFCYGSYKQRAKMTHVSPLSMA